MQRLQTGGALANDLAKELASAFGHCASGRDNIVREQRQERAQQANPPLFAAAREELPAKPSSEPPVVDGGLISDRQPGFAAHSERMRLERLHTIRHRDLHPRHQPEFSDYRDWRGYSPRTFAPQKTRSPISLLWHFQKV